jgi:hypothetical protein
MPRYRQRGGNKGFASRRQGPFREKSYLNKMCTEKNDEPAARNYASSREAVTSLTANYIAACNVAEHHVRADVYQFESPLRRFAALRPHLQGHTSCCFPKMCRERDGAQGNRELVRRWAGSPVPITHNDRSSADVGLQTLSLHQFERSMSRLRKLPIGPQLQHDRGERKTRSKREFILTHEVVGNRGQLE